MSANLNNSLTRVASIVIETTPISRRSRMPGEAATVPCFHSVAWDIKARSIIDERLSYGGSLSDATIKGLEMLDKPSKCLVHCAKRNHIEPYYLHDGQRYEVFAVRNGWVWLSLKPALAQTKEMSPRTDKGLVASRWKAQEKAHIFFSTYRGLARVNSDRLREPHILQ